MKGSYCALPGDSGSAVFFGDGWPVGLIFAVETDSGRTYCCRASKIEELLNVSFTPPKGQNHTKRYFDPARIPKDPRDRFDILVSGISIGHASVTVGTLGAFVWDKATNVLLGLTCAHVAAPFGAKLGDPIYQPGPLDIRERFGREPCEQDICGYLVRWQEISFLLPNVIDAAVFRPVRSVVPDYVLGVGKRILRPSIH